jgi:hypothetical protein
LNNGRNDTSDSAAIISADSVAERGDGTANLVENTSNGPSNGIVSGDGQEAFLDNFFTFAVNIFWQFAFGDTLGHHGDLASFKDIRNEMRYDTHDDCGDYETDGETD